ncbi:hypothetical protein OE749_13630 [Aestuariibacter sp. AA17]|uniref:Ribbon-helix-helix protein CopG domain-containing protein n=1 Tax=Fluctibacter corallii TaxID=2984329 RepID=A0ABT3AAN2_9ALTE|nr:hypothetical protein [Aestuariibacter sp. AA17]MCV2885734.1 hypothetical protein [Aestuariibacter sp. AA17]
MSAPSKKPLTLRLTTHLVDEIQEAASTQGITTQEFIRRAIGTELYLMKEHANGSRVLIQTKDNEVKEIVLR